MTAGSGLIHKEMPEKEFERSGGMMHAFQLWVNLPKRDKMIKPRYQQIASSKIPVATSADGQVIAKVIAGEALAVQAAIETRTPKCICISRSSPNANLATYPTSIQFICLCRKGKGHFGKNYKLAQRGQAVIFSRDGDLVSIKNPSEKKAHRLMFY
jgi:redox-sensitive bicupin YhaK (pirin superfamily)